MWNLSRRIEGFFSEHKAKKLAGCAVGGGQSGVGTLHRRAGRREVQVGEVARWNAMKRFAQPACKRTFLLILDLLQFSGERLGNCLVSFSN